MSGEAPPPPHGDGPTHRAGPPAEDAAAAVLLVHGRGGSAEGMLELAGALRPPPDVALVAPQAAGGSWYPRSFLAPIEENEPGLGSGLAVLGARLEELRAAGVPLGRTVLLGFSQGGCLGLEYAARNPAPYGGVVGLSAGLIGPPGTPRDYPGSLEDAPVFLGCSDVDSHIPLERVRESADVFRRLGARVEERIYEGMGHTVNEDELRYVRDLLRSLS